MFKALPFDPFGSPRNSPRFAKKGPARSPSYPNEISAAMLRQQKLQPGRLKAFRFDQWSYNGFLFVFFGWESFPYSSIVFEKKKRSIKGSETTPIFCPSLGQNPAGQAKSDVPALTSTKKKAFDLQRARSADKAVPDHNRCNSDKKPLARSKSVRKQQERCHTNFVFIISF